VREARETRDAQQEKKKDMAKEEVEVKEGKYGAFRVRMTSGGPKLPRRPYVPQGDSDPRTGLPLGFSNPPKKLQTEAVKMPKPTRAYKEYVRLSGKTPEQRAREEDERQKEMERQRKEYIKQGIIKE
jgi:hypothetical protein